MTYKKLNKKGVFQPTGTSKILVAEALKYSNNHNKILDLGCGTGIVGISILEKYPNKNVFFSDVSSNAIEYTKDKLKKNSLQASELKVGSGLNPWKNYKFDLIICDVAAVSSKLDEISHWYDNEVPNDSGKEGVNNIIDVILTCKEHLYEKGKILFTVISLSNHKKILKNIRSKFKNVDLIKKQHWPFTDEFYKNIDLLQDLKKKNYIDFSQVTDEIFYFDTYIYLAYR